MVGEKSKIMQRMNIDLIKGGECLIHHPSPLTFDEASFDTFLMDHFSSFGT